MIDPITPRIGVGTRPAATLGTAPAEGGPPVGPRAERDRQLRESATQLEGLFVQQLYKAMRDTVPQGDGIVSGGAGEDMFTGLMDQHVAAETPRHWNGGLGEALYRQLRGPSPAPAPASASAPASATGHTVR